MKLFKIKTTLYIYKLSLFHKESTVGQNFKTWSIDSTSLLQKEQVSLSFILIFQRKKSMYTHALRPMHIIIIVSCDFETIFQNIV